MGHVSRTHRHSFTLVPGGLSQCFIFRHQSEIEMLRDPTQSDTQMGMYQHKSMSLSSEKSTSIVTVHKLKNTSSNHSEDDYQSNVPRSNWGIEVWYEYNGEILKIASKLSLHVLWTENTDRNIVAYILNRNISGSKQVKLYLRITSDNHYHSVYENKNQCTELQL